MSLNKVNKPPELTTFGTDTPIPLVFSNMPEFKVVNYCGMPVAVPKGFKWLAMDIDGKVWAYRKKPVLDHMTWDVRYDRVLPFDERECYQVGDITEFSDEDTTLNEVKKSLIRVKKLPRFYP